MYLSFIMNYHLSICWFLVLISLFHISLSPWILLLFLVSTIQFPTEYAITEIFIL